MEIFVCGGTGYLGRPLAARLAAFGFPVTLLSRRNSEERVSAGAHYVLGDALSAASISLLVPPGCTFIHLVGVAHPAPWKEREFRAIDLKSLNASAEAAVRAGVAHFIYVSVAHPAPVMRAYIQVRRECEEILASAGLRRTILRPWYVLGPGHRWPEMLRPVYALLERLESTREGARRLGLVTLDEMVSALAWLVEHPPENVQILDVPAIREKGITASAR